MTQVRNVAAEIIRDLKRFQLAMSCNGFTELDGHLIDGMIQSVDVAQKFLLPPFGILLERQTGNGIFESDEIELLHLPYEICLFAFQCKVAGRDEYVALLCHDVTLDTSSYIRIFPLILAEEHNGRYTWCPDTHQVKIFKQTAEELLTALGEGNYDLAPGAAAEGKLLGKGLGIILLPMFSKKHTVVRNALGYDEDGYNMYNGAVIDTLRIMQCSNVVNVIIPGSGASSIVNKKRISKGKLPLYEYRQLVVDIHETVSHKTGVGSGAKKRQHMRRGHIRKYVSGLRIWVQSCMVGSGDIGRIDKEYKLENRRAT